MKLLVTGPFGQIGSELIPVLQEKYGKENVVALGRKTFPDWYDGPLEKGDVRDKELLATIIEKHAITTVYHLAGILSAKGETMTDETWAINVDSLKHVLDLARDNKLKVFWASSIAVFGPTTPRENTPQRTVLEPTTMYGATKLAGEALCHYYNEKWGVDVRSLRYPGLISWKAPPGGGTTDYAVAIFHGAIKEKKYECFVSESTSLPMMYMDDGIKATLQLMEADPEKLTVRTSYNLGAISFRADELAEEIKKRIPEFECSYAPDQRQAIADSWPMAVDDSQAREDWGWQHEFDLSKMTDVMLDNLKRELGGN
jgi:nucleoside-diphosphate-sugar epimerase